MTDKRQLIPFLEFCEQHSICKSTGYGEAAAGRLCLTKIGSRSYVSQQHAEEWRRNLPTFKPRKADPQNIEAQAA